MKTVNKWSKNETGFTMIELLVAVAIFAMLAGAITALTGMFFNSQKKTTDTLNEVQQSRQTLDILTNELRYAIRIKTVNSNTITYLDNVQNDCTITYNSTNKTISLTRGTETTKIISKGPISSCSFARDLTSLNQVSIDMTLASSCSDNYNLQTTVTNINDF